MATKLTWYFDFISPFAYLQLSQLERLPADCELTLKPVLLAGLLNHWQNTGPAEVAPKRLFTYQHCIWMAAKMGVDYKMPPSHPFNSLLPLRIAVANQASLAVVKTIFEAIWKYGYAPQSESFINSVETALNIQDITTQANQSWVKDALKENTQQAIQNEVFGVPTFNVNNKNIPETANLTNFWGVDAFDMLLDFLNSPSKVVTPELLRANQLPIGAQRKK
ncbi:2-hydroxychromene-2-carboxylate isomerase [Aliikangiella sp. IMCC44653]